jgi:peptide/nickel transport system ATP-binding protein/oligopeptide transport system ATP-binding protein
MRDHATPPLLSTDNLVKRFAKRELTGSPEEFSALNGISLSIYPGTTLAIVGESGCGKSTLALCLACLERPTAGSIWYGETDLVKLAEKDLRTIRPQIQLIDQDPVNSLNPRFTALEIVTEPLVVQGFSRRDREQRAHHLLQSVGLSPQMGARKPAEFSGGQRQRLAIARALALQPRLLILDEALSALDCSVQAQIANLLLELQKSLGMTYLFITHDVTMAAHLADEIAVMDHGRIVERCVPEQLLQHPQHEITRRLLAAAPRFYGAAEYVPQP